MQTSALKVGQNLNLTAGKVEMTDNGNSKLCRRASVSVSLIGKILLVLGAVLAVCCLECSIILEDGALVAVLALCAFFVAVPGWIMIGDNSSNPQNNR